MITQLAQQIIKPFVEKVMTPIKQGLAQVGNLPKLIQAKIVALASGEEASLSDYVKIGRRYYAKRLLILVAAAMICVAGGGYTVFYVKTPPWLAEWIGRNVFVEGAKEAAAFSGTGQILYEQGSVKFDGQLTKGEFTTGKLYNEQGVVIYEGAFKGNLPEGQGNAYTDQGKLLYAGEFKGGVYSGIGILYHPSGKPQFEGEFKNGKLTGAGVEYYEGSQLKFEGTFLDGHYDGKGKLLDATGAPLYEGEFKQGIYNGAGKEFFSNGQVRYEGGFQAGKYHGTGKLSTHLGSLVYEGGLANGQYHGEGSLYSESGLLQYKGGWQSGKKDGTGEWYDAAGLLQYKGGFKADLKEGVGELYDAKNILVYKGYWQGDHPFFPGFLGLSPKQVEGLIDKADDIKMSENQDDSSLYMQYNAYQMSLRLDLASADSKESFVTAVQLWGTYALTEIDNMIKNPKSLQPTNSKMPPIYQVAKDGNVTIYAIYEHWYYCYYHEGKLIRVMITAAS